ncbi:MAG: tetratricopeptide repeat protein [Deltaproteobacteria bacterium]|nr:tetratricopeptide repeat protein [Deltaproteobacteria bacterium]
MEMKVPGKKRLHLAAVMLLVAATYSPILTYGFTNWDDPYFFYENQRLQHAFSMSPVQGLLEVINPGPAFAGKVVDWIPLRDVAAYLLGRTVGLKGQAIHGLELLFHLISTAMVFLIAIRLSSSVPAASFAALFFGIHPAGVEVTAWAAELKTAMGVGFGLSSLFLYMKAVETTGRAYITNLLASLALATLSCLSSQYGVLVGFWVLLFDVAIRPSTRQTRRAGENKFFNQRRIAAWAAFGALSLAALAFHLKIRAVAGVFSTWPAGTFEATAGRTIKSLPLYVLNLALPVSLCPRQTIEPVLGFFDIGFWLGILTISAGIGVLAWSVKARGRFLFLFLLGTSYLVPTLNLFPSTVIMADRYLYVPAAAMGIGIGLLADRLNSSGMISKKVLQLSMGALLAVFIALTFANVRTWRSSEALWTAVLDCSPGFFGAHHQLGMLYFGQGQVQKALPYFEEAARLAPGNSIVHNSLGDAFHALSKIDKAENEYRMARKTARNDLELARAFNGLGLCAFARKDYKKALGLFQKAEKLEPESRAFRKNLERANKALSSSF